jgi:hypothetical protein
VLVKTSGRFAGSRGSGNSWLLIKHKDDWSGDVDIAEFAPRSVKSDGDFEDILAEDNPAIWHSNRPAKGGDTGKMFESIIERAAAIKAGRKPGAKVAKVKPGRAATSAAPAAATKKAASEKTAARKTGARKTAGKSRTSK